MTLEKIYQKKTQIEHILLRPDSYIGSVETTTQNMWVWNEQKGLHMREITYVPGLYKIFDEILVNAADNKIRDKNMNCIKVKIDVENNVISIWNNGKGIPVTMHKTEKMFIPEMIFGHLLTSSNFDDNEKKVTGGRNGYGAKLCNIFSKRFTVETATKEYNKKYKQTWTDNMSKSGDAVLTEHSGPDYTCVKFTPDLSKFKMDVLNDDIVDLFSKRAFDIAATTCVRVYLNDQKLPVGDFKDYINLYTKNFERDNSEEEIKIVYEKFSPRWEVAVTNSDKGFQSISFVNSISTSKGGTHVDYITDQIVAKLMDIVNKKNKNGIKIKPFQVKNHLCIFINCLVENPTFDSQTKENMTLSIKSFGSKCLVSDKFLASISKIGCIENIMNWIHFKAQNQLNTKCLSKKQIRLKGIPKLDDANDAGTKNSLDCTLILTEGDSAKTLAVSGLSIVGRDRFGIFPLRGKLLNVREATHKQLLENAEINNVIKIIGLQYKKQYNTLEDLKSLRYGKILIMSDQDQDGSHIKGLIINFIHFNWPSLIKLSFLDQFITPIVKVFKGKEEKSFFSLPEFYEWKKQNSNWNLWKIKYYKGLGTSTANEAKEYFNNMTIHRIKFKYNDDKDDDSILLAFSKKRIEDRKTWLKNWMESRESRKQQNLPETFLYGKQANHLTYADFINKELVLFSNMDNERSIPSLCDGLKPGQRKVLFTCFKRNDKREIKVAQLAGSIAELSAYHHGEASLMSTVINLAQNFVGSNNINLLQPIGQFGTRLHGGKDNASPRYIFTKLSPVARNIFSPLDDPLLAYLQDDNLKIEPEWYLPIVPMVLINGAEGIGTGWSTKIPNYDASDVISNLRLLIEASNSGKDNSSVALKELIPKYKGFMGDIIRVDTERVVTFGEIRVIGNTGDDDDDLDFANNRGDQNNNKDSEVELEISELPIKKWTQEYKENVLEIMLNGSEKTQPIITDYKEYNTDTSVKFLIKMTKAKYLEAQKEGLHKFFKLLSLLSLASMVLFDPKGVIKKYDSPEQILHEFFHLRLTYYRKRKDYYVGLLSAEARRLDFQARFVLEKIKGVIVVENKKRFELIDTLISMGYEPDPVKRWKQKVMGEDYEDDTPGGVQDEESTSIEGAVDKKGESLALDFDYLLGMKLWNLTKERVDELIQKQKIKNAELIDLKQKTPQMLWITDLDNLSTEIKKLEAKELLEMNESKQKLAAGGKGSKLTSRKLIGKKGSYAELSDHKNGTRIVPEVDASLKIKIEKAKELKEKKKIKSNGDDQLNSHELDKKRVNLIPDLDDEITSNGIDDFNKIDDEDNNSIEEIDSHLNPISDKLTAAQTKTVEKGAVKTKIDETTKVAPKRTKKIIKIGDELGEATGIGKKQKKINTFFTANANEGMTNGDFHHDKPQPKKLANGYQKDDDKVVKPKAAKPKKRMIYDSDSQSDFEGKNDIIDLAKEEDSEFIDSELIIEPESPPPLRARLGRHCGAKQYKFSDSENEDDS